MLSQFETNALLLLQTVQTLSQGRTKGRFLLSHRLSSTQKVTGRVFLVLAFISAFLAFQTDENYFTSYRFTIFSHARLLPPSRNSSSACSVRRLLALIT